MAVADGDKIVKVAELNTPISRVWKALTDYREFGQWFRVDLDQPFEAGAKSTGRMTYPGHEDCPWIAYVERMDQERLFSFRWYDSDGDASEKTHDEPGLLVEFELEATSNGTRLTITESGFSTLPDPRRIEAMRDNEEGWNIQAGNIARYLSA